MLDRSGNTKSVLPHEKDSKNLSIDLTLFQVSRATPITSMLFDILSVLEEGIEEIWAGSIILKPVQ